MIIEFGCYVVWLLAFQIFLLLFQESLGLHTACCIGYLLRCAVLVPFTQVYLLVELVVNDLLKPSSAALIMPKS